MIITHIKTIEAEINATGKRLETEELTADDLIALAERMGKLGQTLTWLKAVHNMKSKVITPSKIIN